MKRLDFRPETDGFAFGNSWQMQPNEINVFPRLMIDVFHRSDSDLQDMFRNAARGASAGVVAAAPFAAMAVGRIAGTGVGLAAGAAAGAAVGGVVGAAVGAILTFFGIWGVADPEDLAEKALKKLLPHVPSAGFCGGMTAAALDYYFDETVLPRGGKTQPKSVGTRDDREIWLRDYIFQRLVDSLRLNGHRFLELQAFYHLGDSDDVVTVMRQVTEWACNQIINEIDSGRPCGVGLVTTSIDPSKSHQILCYGYNRPRPGTIDLLVYDNNRPDRECTIRVVFSEKSATVLHPDNFLSGTNGGFNSSGLNPSYCTLILLDYDRKTPQPAVIVNGRLTPTPHSLVLGSKVDFNAELRNRGFGKSPKAIVRFAQGSRFGSDMACPELEQEQVQSVAFSDVPTSAGPTTYSLNYRQETSSPYISVVTRLEALGLGQYVASLCVPFAAMQAPMLNVVNALSAGLPTMESAPVLRRKRVPNENGNNVTNTIGVFEPRIFLDSPDIGDECDPRAWPGAKIRLIASPEPELKPVSPAVSYDWLVVDDQGSPWQTFNTIGPQITIVLPETIGANVTAKVTARYRGVPSTLQAELSIRIVDKAANEFAQGYCETRRKILEMARTVKIWPQQWEPDWQMRTPRISIENIVVDQMTTQVRSLALAETDLIARQGTVSKWGKSGNWRTMESRAVKNLFTQGDLGTGRVAMGEAKVIKPKDVKRSPK